MTGGIRNDHRRRNKNARQRIGKTLEELADETDYSPRQLSRFEKNENLVRYDKFLQLIVALELYKPVQKVDL